MAIGLAMEVNRASRFWLAFFSYDHDDGLYGCCFLNLSDEQVDVAVLLEGIEEDGIELREKVKKFLEEKLT